jgi:hypothetical protein
MTRLASTAAVLLVAGLLVAGWAAAADDSRMKQGTKELEGGAKQVGQGVVDAATGLGKTVVGGAEVAGDKIKAASDEATPKAKSAWAHVRDGSVKFGQSVKVFFTRLFTNAPNRGEPREESRTTMVGGAARQ